MILADYNQAALAVILSFQRELKGNEAEVKNLIRHVILSTFKSHKKQYSKEYGELVICCDAKSYWRKEVFAQYKGLRKKNRDASDLNWNLIFSTLEEIRTDLIEHFPYKVLLVNRCEADDIIAVMTKWLQENELVNTGLIEEPQKTLILSSDKDFKQLHVYPTVRQWSPMQKKFIRATKQEIKDWMIEHIVKGDSGDGVANILSPATTLVDGIRQKPMSAKRLEEFLKRGIDACTTDEERKRWGENETLVSFDKIPQDISDSIISAYLNNKPNKDKMAVYEYLIKHRCNLLLSDIQDF